MTELNLQFEIVNPSNSTQMLLRLLTAHQADEPPKPDLDLGNHVHEEQSRVHDEWHRQLGAWRQVAAYQLLGDALRKI